MRILAIIAPALFIVSCAADPQKVAIRLEYDEFLPGIIEDITYECDSQIIDGPDIIFDSAARKYQTRWDTAAPGEYTVAITTVFGTSTVQRYAVKNDAVLRVRNNLPYKSTGFISKEQMLNADVVQFVRVVCEHAPRELLKITLTRNGMGYELTEAPARQFTSNQPRQLSTEQGLQIIEEFVSVEGNVEPFYGTGPASESSSNRRYIFFRADDLVYSYQDDNTRWISAPDTYIP